MLVLIMKQVVYLTKGIILVKKKVVQPLDWIMSYLNFYINGVEFSTFKNTGWPRVNVGLGGKCIIGKNFRSNNREMSNPIGRFNKCSIIVGNDGFLIIGNNVGMSSTAIVCHKRIEIGDNVKIGGNVVIYDTDFHSLNPNSRLDPAMDRLNTKKVGVKIENSAFIGAHSTILKGENIGENSIIGAGSVVTKSIPSNQIWAGNPAKFVKEI